MSLGLTATNFFEMFFDAAAAGDAIIARCFAVDLLSKAGAPRHLDPYCRLLLTASLLHLQGRSGAPSTPSDIVRLFEQLKEIGGADAVFGGSPLQLVRFAETEFVELSVSLRAAVLEGCLRAIRRQIEP